MGRHSTGTNNYTLSKGAIALLVALGLILLITVGVWAAQRNSTDDSLDARGDGQPNCVSGELALPIAASSLHVAQELVTNYANTQPVVRDYCVQPVAVDTIADAAVYVAPNTPISHQEIDHAGRSAATNEPPAVYATGVGLAGSEQVDPNTVDIAQVQFSANDQPEASAVVASALAENDQQAISALTDQRIESVGAAQKNATSFVAVSDHAVPDGLQFSPLEDTSIVYSAIPLNTAEGVNEDQVRAGQAFTEFAQEQFAGSDEQLPVLAESVWAAALPEGGERITAPAGGDSSDAQGADSARGEVNPMDTLFLLDTSEAMAPFAGSATEGIGQAAGTLVDGGNRVGLWNYSSPMSPGVTQGFRTNLALGSDAASVAAVAGGFINGGEPRTHEALAAALAYAQGAKDGDQPVRVVLITSGTADAGGDIGAAIEQAKEAGVELSIVHVGEAGEDTDLSAKASHVGNAPSADEISDAITVAAGV